MTTIARGTPTNQPTQPQGPQQAEATPREDFKARWAASLEKRKEIAEHLPPVGKLFPGGKPDLSKLRGRMENMPSLEELGERADGHIDALEESLEEKFPKLSDALERVPDLSDLGAEAQAKLKSIAARDLTPQQRSALERTRDMLEPDKLGGADRTFNYGDRQAVTCALLRDRCGISSGAQAELRSRGKPLAAMVVRGAMKRNGPFGSGVRARVRSEASAQIRAGLNQGLAQAKIDPNTANTPDTVRRNITVREMTQFEEDGKLLQKMQDDISERLGIEVTFPDGISQESIQHTLDGKMGIPPGATIKADPDRWPIINKLFPDGIDG